MFFPIYLLSAAGFTVLTTEFVIVGLLPAIARDLAVTIPQAGLLVTLFAFTVACFGPFLTAYFSRFERKRLFISVLIMFGFANAVAAMAPNIGVMAIARLIPALGLPVFWALASETAVDIAVHLPAEERAQGSGVLSQPVPDPAQPDHAGPCPAVGVGVQRHVYGVHLSGGHA
jgi:predicted MFS family arabinose efflux permease